MAKRLGDIFPKDDVLLVLGGKEYKLQPPSLKTLSKIEHWYESITKEKLRWNEIFGKTTELTIENFVQFVRIMLEASNSLVPTEEELLNVINTVNYGQCVQAIGSAMINGTPEASEKSSGNSSGVLDWQAAIQFAVQEKNISYAEFQAMTVREFEALLARPKEEKQLSVNATKEEPGKPDPLHEIVDGLRPRWLVDAMDKARKDGINTDVDSIQSLVAQSRMAVA
jgi:hypothetical protein